MIYKVSAKRYPVVTDIANCNGGTRTAAGGQGLGGTMQRSAVQQAGTTAKSHVFSSTYSMVDKMFRREGRKKGREGRKG